MKDEEWREGKDRVYYFLWNILAKPHKQMTITGTLQILPAPNQKEVNEQDDGCDEFNRLQEIPTYEYSRLAKTLRLRWAEHRFIFHFCAI